MRHDDDLTEKDIAARFEEAVYTLKRLPRVYVQGYHSLWPPIVYTTWEIMAQEKKPFRLGPPQPDAIDRMEDVFVWIGWLDQDDRHLVWMRAARLPWRMVCMRIGVSKTVAWQRWTAALLKVATRINADPKLKKRGQRKQK